MKKQLITLCLLASFLLAGCGNTTPATSTDTTAATGNDSVVTTAPEPEKDPLMDDLGECDFGGGTFGTVFRQSSAMAICGVSKPDSCVCQGRIAGKDGDAPKNE